MSGAKRQYKLLMPRDLHDRISTVAKRDGQSMNTKIVRTLEEAFPQPIEPESINANLRFVASEILVKWADMLAAIGEIPGQNPELTRLTKILNDIEEMD